MTPLPRPQQQRRRALQTIGTVCATALVAPSLLAQSKTAPRAASIDLLEAINQAGRQRMLSQRMAKLYAQQLLDVRGPQARELLAKSIALFETQLHTLDDFSQAQGAEKVVRSYQQLKTQWLDYKSVIGAPATSAGLLQASVLNEQVLSTANQATGQLEALYKGNLGALVNIAGRQRMLSQRMSKFYFFKACKLNDAGADKGLVAARSEFIQALQKLKKAPENSADINSWLAMAETQWAFFDDAINMAGNARVEQAYLYNNVAVSSENLLEVMNKVTGLYSSLKTG